MLKTPVKERAKAQATTMNEKQRHALTTLANDLHRLNNSVISAVEAGLSVELQRASRHHAGGGFWGDLMIPIIVKQSEGTAEQNAASA